MHTALGTVTVSHGRSAITLNGCTYIKLLMRVYLSATSLLQSTNGSELDRSGSFSSQQENIHEIFDFSKVPDVDPKTRLHLGSECTCFTILTESCRHLVQMLVKSCI